MKYLLMAFPKATFEKTQEASKVPSAGDGPGGRRPALAGSERAPHPHRGGRHEADTMKRSSSANTLTCLPRAPILEKVVEDEVEMQPASEVAYLERERKRSVTRQELQVKEKLFQAMVRAPALVLTPTAAAARRTDPCPLPPLLPTQYYCAMNDLDGLKLVYHNNPKIISEANYDNRTCLHIAAASGRKEIVSWLLSYGAPTDPVDNWGHTPWHEAKRGNHSKVARLLEEAGRKNSKSSEAK